MHGWIGPLSASIGLETTSTSVRLPSHNVRSEWKKSEIEPRMVASHKSSCNPRTRWGPQRLLTLSFLLRHSSFYRRRVGRAFSCLEHFRGQTSKQSQTKSQNKLPLPYAEFRSSAFGKRCMCANFLGANRDRAWMWGACAGATIRRLAHRCIGCTSSGQIGLETSTNGCLVQLGRMHKLGPNAIH